MQRNTQKEKCQERNRLYPRFLNGVSDTSNNNFHGKWRHKMNYKN